MTHCSERCSEPVRELWVIHSAVVLSYLSFLNAEKVAGHQLECFRVVLIVLYSFVDGLFAMVSSALLHAVKQ